MTHARAAAGSLLFLFVVVLNLLPLSAFKYIPSEDGPCHVYNASLLRSYVLDPGSNARHAFVFNASIPPNLLVHSLLAAELGVLPPVAAERVVVLLYAVLLPIAFRYLLRSLSPQTHGLEFLSLFLVYNSHLHWGFYNFLFSIIFFLFAAGFWIRHRSRATPYSALILGSLVLVLYCSHPVGLFEYWLACIAILSMDWFGNRKVLPDGLTLFLVSSLPAAALYLHYLGTAVPAASEATTWPTLRYSTSLFLTLSPLATYSVWQRLLAVGVWVFLIAAYCCTSRRPVVSKVNGYLVAGMFASILIFLAPTSAGGGTMLTPRLIYFPVIWVCVWLVSLDWRPIPVSPAFVGFALLLAIGMGASNWIYYQRYDTKVRAFFSQARSWPTDPYVSLRTPEPTSPLFLDRHSSPYLSYSLVAYLAAERKQVLLGEYQASLNYFPLRYRDIAVPGLRASNTTAWRDCSRSAYDNLPGRAGAALSPHISVVLVPLGKPNAENCSGESPYARITTPDFLLLYYDSTESSKLLGALTRISSTKSR